MRKLLTLAFSLAFASTALAQAADDGVLLAKGNLVVGDIYVHNSWDRYWEGTLKRTNGNIGTVTTRANVIFGAYGINDGLTVMASLPYVWTRPSMGVLHPMKGVQDLTLALKASMISRPNSPIGRFRLIGVMAGGMPVGNYTPDFAPLSIGMGAGRLTGRLTASVQPAHGWFTNGSGGFTLRGNVKLDRPYYFTEDVLTFSDSVGMPNVFDYSLVSGIARNGYMGAFGLSQQYTLGGGDIRRQDMPFVSNRMNFTNLSGMVQAPVPKAGNLSAQFAYTYTVHGRNVGQGTTLSGGLVYRVPFLGGGTQ